MEVLEMLAMSGADLNAKNKNDETPSGLYIFYILSIYLSMRISLILMFRNIF